jgi:hypothetical protein
MKCNLLLAVFLSSVLISSALEAKDKKAYTQERLDQKQNYDVSQQRSSHYIGIDYMYPALTRSDFLKIEDDQDNITNSIRTNNRGGSLSMTYDYFFTKDIFLNASVGYLKQKYNFLREGSILGNLDHKIFNGNLNLGYIFQSELNTEPYGIFGIGGGRIQSDYIASDDNDIRINKTDIDNGFKPYLNYELGMRFNNNIGTLKFLINGKLFKDIEEDITDEESKLTLQKPLKNHIYNIGVGFLFKV